VDYITKSVVVALRNIDWLEVKTHPDFGYGKSTQLFLESMENQDIWSINHQKQYIDI